MIKVVGVRFKKAGKIYYFDPVDMNIQKDTYVVVETARGIEFGECVIGIKEINENDIVSPLKSVLRIATNEDIEKHFKNKDKEKDAFDICLKKIQEHGLTMKLIDVEYTFDNNKVIFYFTADGRVDFRDLVKDLATIFKTRIELRQIGVRDEAKMLGGLGPCGRPMCCSSFLGDFASVSIKMAKEQNLSLNPTKISGVCGRLMCCLKNEQETYEYLNSRLPGIGDPVTAVDGAVGEVQSVNVLRQKVKVLVEVDDEKELREYDVEELKFRPRKKNTKVSSKELKELSSLEDENPETIERRPEGREREKREGRERRERDQNPNRDNRDRNDRNDRNNQNDKGDKGDKSDRNDCNRNGEQSQQRNHYRKNRNNQKDRGNGKDRVDRGDRANRGGEKPSQEDK